MEEKKFIPLIYEEHNKLTGHNIKDFIIWAVEQGTSDVTLKSNDKAVCEIHGRMHRVSITRLTTTDIIGIMSYIYESDGATGRLNSGNDVDCHWAINIGRGEKLRFRVNMTSILSDGSRGYEITIRTILSEPPLLDGSLTDEVLEAMTARQGMVIISGGTGSGKSTLLASVIRWRAEKEDAHLKILTYESPIEFTYDMLNMPTTVVSQTEIGTHLPTFASGVRNALRRKPNVILIGELRDRETINEATTAAITGHLLMSTLHTNGVAEVVPRMINEFSTEERRAKAMDILSSIKIVVSQMLVPSTDGKRVAVREYLIFNKEIVNYLLEDLDNISKTTREMLNKYGHTFTQDAKRLFEENRIEEKEYLRIKFSTEG